MKTSEAQGAENAPKSLQFSTMSCGDESIRRRNKRAAHEKKTAKHAPFSYRKVPFESYLAIGTERRQAALIRAAFDGFESGINIKKRDTPTGYPFSWYECS
jgi:hypothetical protein